MNPYIRLRSFVFLLLFAAAGAFGESAERGLAIQKKAASPASRVALVIGNSGYAESPLRNPVNDAADIGSVLGQLGFKVSLLLDADFPTMSQAVSEFGRTISGDGGVALFFFAGHGMQVGGRNFLIPVRADIGGEEEVPYKAIDAGLVLSKMESAGSTTNILILDACRNNPFARSFRSGNRGLAQMDAPTGTLIVYATAPGDVAYDGVGENGVFTENLLRNIATPDLDVELMFRQVRVGVLDQTGGKQTPWTSSSLQGNFAFTGAVTDLPQIANASPRIVPAIAPRRSWQRDLPADTEIEDLIDGGALRFAITTSGHSAHDDSASRRIMGQKDAMRNVSAALKTRLAFHDVKASSSQLKQLESSGELTDLVYLDDGRTVQLTFEIPIPASMAKSILPQD